MSSNAGQQGSSCQAMPASRFRRVKQCRQLSSAPREVLAFGRWCDGLSRWQLFTVFELVHDTREVVLVVLEVILDVVRRRLRLAVGLA